MCKDSHPCRLKNLTIGNLNGYYNVGSSCKNTTPEWWLSVHITYFFLSQCGSNVHEDHLKMSLQR